MYYLFTGFDDFQFERRGKDKRELEIIGRERTRGTKGTHFVFDYDRVLDYCRTGYMQPSILPHDVKESVVADLKFEEVKTQP